MARALRRHRVEHEQIRTALRRRGRPEIESLSGQRRVPVLVIDGEAISDSRRIVEHLEHRTAARAAARQSSGRSS